jgi:GntR family transcriptional regulator
LRRTAQGPGRLSLDVRERLVSRIASGGVVPGSRLPPEPELAAELGVSRATLREALRLLEDDGFITRTRGAGTFVTGRQRLTNNLDVNFGVTDAIRAAGMRPGTATSEVRRRKAGVEVAERLNLERGAGVYEVERVRTADGRRVVFSRDVVPASLFEGSDELVPKLAGGSIYELLERELGVTIHHGVASIRPVKADRRMAHLLWALRGALLLHLRQVDTDEDGRPVLYSDEYHLADAFEFTVVRRGPGKRIAT